MSIQGNIIQLTITIIAFIAPVSANSQRVTLDRIEYDGSHQIMAKDKKFFFGDREFSFGLKLFERNNSKYWLLIVSSFYYMPDVSTIHFKLDNNDIIDIPVDNVNKGKVYIPGYAFNYGSFTSYTQPENLDYYSSVYELKESVLDVIDKQKIVEVKIDNGYKTILYGTFDNNRLGKLIRRSHKNILSWLKSSDTNFY